MISANLSEISAIKRASSLSHMNAIKILIGKQLRAEIIIGTNEFTANNPSSLEHFNCWRVMRRENDVYNVAV